MNTIEERIEGLVSCLERLDAIDERATSSSTMICRETPPPPMALAKEALCRAIEAAAWGIRKEAVRAPSPVMVAWPDIKP